jgi:NitT/TauT family transport system ATP-binding protein
MSREAAVRLAGVSKQFETDAGPFTAVCGVDLEVAPGEFVAVVGPSGCGKSTLLGMVSGLSPATGGSVEVAGRPVTGIPSGLGYLFQRDALLPWKTVLDNVSLPLVFRRVPRGEARERARGWLARVGLSRFAAYHPHALSGGMRKRVSLAATMVADPDIVLMDEPFSALDVQTRNLMENELLAIWQESRKTVLFITHDLEEAIALSDRVVVMTASPGRIKAEYPIPLPRPRSVTEIRFRPEFVRLYETVWGDLRDEVLASYAQAQRG